MVFVIAGIVIVGYLFVRARRRRKASGIATSASGVEVGRGAAVYRPPEPPAGTCPVCQTGVARCAVVACPMPG